MGLCMYQGSKVLGRPWRKIKGQWTVRRKTDFIQLFWHLSPAHHVTHKSKRQKQSAVAYSGTQDWWEKEKESSDA